MGRRLFLTLGRNPLRGEVFAVLLKDHVVLGQVDEHGVFLLVPVFPLFLEAENPLLLKKLDHFLLGLRVIHISNDHHDVREQGQMVLPGHSSDRHGLFVDVDQIKIGFGLIIKAPDEKLPSTPSRRGA